MVMDFQDQPYPTGALQRPHDPASEKYQLVRTVGPMLTPDWSKVVSLARYRSPVRNQGRYGACAAFASGGAAEMTARFVRSKINQPLTIDGLMFGGPVVFDEKVQDLHYSYVYRLAREKRNFFGQPVGSDTGSYTEDCLDLYRNGVPNQVTEPLTDNPQWVPSDALKQSPFYDYVLSYRPFYPNGADGIDAVSMIWNSLNMNLPVVIAMSWEQQFFQPDAYGVLPLGVPTRGSAGGHAVLAYDIIPGYVLCANSWSASWNPNAVNFGHEARPGDFAIPFEYIQGSNSKVWNFQAVTAEALPPKPTPPTPPEPTPPTPPTPETGKVRAQAITSEVINDLMSQYKIKKTTSLYYKIKGAGLVKDRINSNW
jgi:hypothetical protein